MTNVLHEVILKVTGRLDDYYSFEWDINKADSNYRKHGVTFENAAKAFLDEERLEYYDMSHSENEDRYITIGLVNSVLTVVYTFRDPDIRIISARKANKKERNEYYGHKESFNKERV